VIESPGKNRTAPFSPNAYGVAYPIVSPIFFLINRPESVQHKASRDDFFCTRLTGIENYILTFKEVNNTRVGPFLFPHIQIRRQWTS
jgi:hypothetical protein